MAHHAYFVTGDIEEGIAKALVFAETKLGLHALANPDIVTIRHGLLSVEDARKLRSLANLSPTQNTQKVLIISAARLFHEAQNALLKLFEEPPEGTFLILILPAEGILLPTLRSRLVELPAQDITLPKVKSSASVSHAQRVKSIAKILDRAKSDTDEEKQTARLSAIVFVEDLTKDTYLAWCEEKDPKKREALQLLLEELHAFLPILHERSAPLKLIFEHLLLVM